jgi:very-short-patch-repair endonuclease
MDSKSRSTEDVDLTDAEGRVARLLAEQNGAIRRDQFLSCGLTESRRRRSARAGKLEPRYPSVFVQSRRAGTFITEVSAAVLWARTDAAVSHRTAGHRWKLAGCLPLPVHLTGTAKLYGPPGVVWHEMAVLDVADTVSVAGLRFTNAACTIIDVAQTADRGEVAAIVDDAVMRGLLSPSWLDATARRLVRPGRRRAGLVVDAVAPWVNHTPESVAETELVRWLLSVRLSTFVTQHWVSVGRFRYRLDVAWPAEHVCVEIDGLRHHASVRAIAGDRERENRLEAAGWTVLRTTSRELARGAPDLLTRLRALPVA